MTTARILRFPARPIFIPIRAYHAADGVGPVVAVLFHMPVDHRTHPERDRDQACGDDSAAQGVVEVKP